MTPNGNTNVTIGLAWGWHALTAERAAVGSRGAGDRSRQGADHPDRRHQHRILEELQQHHGHELSRRSTTAPSSPAPTSRRPNIKLYAIRVIDGNADLLQECATNPTMYYDVQNASQLNTVFSAIAQNLANLRLAK